jgi:OOP family OmpA-OmpF porin
MAPAQTASFSANAKVKDVISKAIWKIEFESGKATFKAGSQETLDDLLNQLSAGDMTIQIKGYTDNVGNDESNLALSNKRANAVKAWLSANAPGTMTADRIKAIGYGGASPIADNATPTGRAQNRRVEILQVTTN